MQGKHEIETTLSIPLYQRAGYQKPQEPTNTNHYIGKPELLDCCCVGGADDAKLDGKVNLIFAETKGYLTANTREFCYWLHFIFNLEERVDIITDDDQFNINTILNADKQREALIKMAEDYIYLNPPDHQKWLNGVVSAITNLREDG